MHIASRSVPAPARDPFLYSRLEEAEGAFALVRDSGATLKLWLAVMYRSRLTGSDHVTLTSDLCRRFGLPDRKARYRELRFWTSAGFWIVDPSPPPPGKSIGVRILSTPGVCRRRSRLFRCSVSAISGTPAASCVILAPEALEVRVPWSPLRAPLINAHKTAAVFDVELVDHGSGWLLSEFLPPNDVPLPPQLIETLPVACSTRPIPIRRSGNV